MEEDDYKWIGDNFLIVIPIPERRSGRERRSWLDRRLKPRTSK
jgi:hypothetical protein